MAISTTMPAITHVAVTVTDLEVSEAWYTKVLGVEPVLDEDTGPFRHIVFPLGGTLLGLHGFPDLAQQGRRSTSAARASTTSRSAARTATSSWSGRPASTSSASPTASIVDAGYGSGPVVPRPRQHRARALRPAGVTC